MSKQGRWVRHQRDNGTGPFQDRPETLLSVVLKVHGREMSRAWLNGNLEPSSPLLRSEGDNICTGRRLAHFAIRGVVGFLQCCHECFSLAPIIVASLAARNVVFGPVFAPVVATWNRSCKASLSPLIWPQESFAVEVDEVRRRVSTPDFGFPRNLSKVACHNAAIRKGRDID